MAYPVLRHRISLNYEALAEEIKVDNIIETILQNINI
jgi:MoxR-like ATPase